MTYFFAVSKAGTWVWDLVAKTTVGGVPITATGASIRITIEVTDPCATATDPDIEDRPAKYVIGQTNPLRIRWAGFTFTNYKCNDGSIPFPTCYSGVIDATLPATISITEDLLANEWQAPEWVVFTDDTALLLETYVLSYSSVYLSVKTDTQIVNLVINDHCEAIEEENAPVIKVTTPIWEEPAEYYLSGAPLEIIIPAFTIVPSDCVMSLKVTIPTELAEIVLLTTATLLTVWGPIAVTGEYEITVQAKTPQGTLIPGAILEIPLHVHAAKMGNIPVLQVTTIALSVGSALVSTGIVNTAVSNVIAPTPVVEPV